MLSENILKNLSQGNLVQAKEETESLLYQKLNDAIDNFETNYISDVYSQSKGVASIVAEKKKANDDEEETKYAKSTDKENDSEDDSGETLDPVGKGDDDIDNDGDSDSSDDYLKNRRKKIGKAIDKDEPDETNEQSSELQELAPLAGLAVKGAMMLGKAALSKTGMAAGAGYMVGKGKKDWKQKQAEVGEDTLDEISPLVGAAAAAGAGYVVGKKVGKDKEKKNQVASEGWKAAGAGAGVGAVVGGPIGAAVGGALGSRVGKKKKEVNETDAESVRQSARAHERAVGAKPGTNVSAKVNGKTYDTSIKEGDK